MVRVVHCCWLMMLLIAHHHRPIAAEWLDIRPMQSTDDTMHVHLTDQLMRPAAPATTSLPHNPFIVHRLGVAVTVQPKPLDGPTATIVPPIRYEDLEHIVGPGFEEELERFYEQHKHELDESTRRSDVNGGAEGIEPVASTKPPKIYYVPGDDDPWSQYDKPMLPHAPQTGVTETMVTEVEVTSQTEDNVTSPTEATTTTTTTAKPKAKRVIKMVPMRLVSLPATETTGETTSTGLIGFPGFVGFLKNIQDSFVTNTSRSILDKVQMLKTFRDTMLRQIKKNIRSLWPIAPPPTTEKTASRGKREAEHDGHHMEFPSSEGALMTISFLTFAVFLIKLVLQVINTIKSKHYSYNSFDSLNGGGGTVTALNVIKHNRNARHVSLAEDLDTTLTARGLNVANVLQAVEKLRI